LEGLTRHFITFLLIAVACYAALVLFGEGGKVFFTLKSFPLSYLPLLMGLALLNYLLRYVRWHIYLKASGINFGYWKSFQIFMAGLTMTVTPAKLGEALKGHLLKRESGNPWSKGLSVVFAERLTDLMAVVILVAVGLKVLALGVGPLLLGVSICIVLLLITVQPTFFKAVVWFLGKLPLMAKRSKWLLEMHENVKRLMSPRLMLIAVLISCIAWFSECLVLYFALLACKFQASCLQATFIYALSTLAGALSFLPGGLVATEGSMTGLLLLFDLGRNQAVLVTFIVRLCTLWLAVFLGMIFLFFFQKNTIANRGLALGERDALIGETDTLRNQWSDKK